MPQRVWEFNRGEWTEAYVFLKLLAEGRIYAAGEGLVRDRNVYIDIVNILRYEQSKILKFERDMTGETHDVTASEDDVVFRVICCDELADRAAFLYDAIKNAGAGERKMSVPAIQDYLTGMRISSPKVPKLPAEAERRYGSKTDIIITMEDSTDRTRSTEGFSIKSHLGNASTLFNSSTNSGIVYKVEGCTDELMHRINAIDGDAAVIKGVKDYGLTLSYFGSKSDAFKENLEFIELTMPSLMSTFVLIQCGYLESADTSMTKDIVGKLAEINPLNRRNPEWYKAKFKDFLFAAFSGMTAIKPWDGRRRMTGGYIDVNRNGDLLYYRAMSDDVFGTYLYENTFVDRPSRGVEKDLARARGKAYQEHRVLTDEEIYAISHKPTGEMKPKKGDWGYIYKDGDSYFMSINFQVRFK